ncbi:hypothetical protein BDE36_2409 [Arcticibacter tournemirensis]|uniref:Uncharacterized protein n=1 Tax=Arcticibacter tournemirensis TaxID=699437 RepID=A0A5M9H3V4_9SPHI|nr:hypothetical protein [Arcticibacter tournemirensis]KAA8480057.1 hypothetical protein F1649_15645 [Arcticibacter tournemirensis]TQM50657.1 hypothetical protein BDE36_2409 [Arcticibacter tournemirensis]
MEWYNIEDGKLPEMEEPVLLAKQPTDDLLSKCRLGRMVIEDNTHEKGWFVGNDTEVINLASRPYWIKLIDVPIGIPENENEAILKGFLENYMQSLRLFEKKFQVLAVGMISSGKGLYPLDYFISGILNRGLSLIYGFETLIGTANFLSAAHLVRPHLDNYLRLSAAWLVTEPHTFANNVWKGEIIRKMKDRNGKLMTDRYLKDQAAIDYPWITSVYEATSGFIHFSDKHIANAIKLTKDKEQSLTTFIGKVDNEVSMEAKIEATIGMIEISNCIAKQVYGWIETKRIKG